MRKDSITRRALLRGGLAAAGGTVAAAVPSGCATMPHAGATATAHACSHRFCRYHVEVHGEGRCTLAVRVKGGEP